MKEVVVLGGGIAGIAYCYFHKDKENIMIYEKEGHWGGLCHSFQIQGFTFDSAVHLSFTKEQMARKVFDEVQYICHEPQPVNYYFGNWIKHPVINNIYPLPISQKVELLYSYINRKKNIDINNYQDWLISSYGEAFSKEFYEKYTKKYWTFPAKELSTTWIGQRLNVADMKLILEGAFGESNSNNYYAKEMRYPIEGGYQSFLIPMLDESRIMLNHKAVKLDLNEKKVWFSDGGVVHYDKLVSSIPLPELVSITDNVPQQYKENAKKLKATQVSIVSMGFNKPDIPKYLWFYIYDDDILAARVNSPSIKSLNNAPAGCSSMQFEIYHSMEEKPDVEKIKQNVKDALHKMGICTEKDIIFIDYRLLPYGNVVYTLGMEKWRDPIIEYYTRNNVQLVGRFGKWEYLWSDQSMLSSML